jgi:hypothetical protein
MVRSSSLCGVLPTDFQYPFPRHEAGIPPDGGPVITRVCGDPSAAADGFAATWKKGGGGHTRDQFVGVVPMN